MDDFEMSSLPLVSPPMQAPAETGHGGCFVIRCMLAVSRPLRYTIILGKNSSP